MKTTGPNGQKFYSNEPLVYITFFVCLCYGRLFKFCLMYFRWLCYCHVPAFCDSLPRYETTLIFGRTLLRSVFQTMRRQLLDKFRAEKEKMPPEKRTLVLTHFPRYGTSLTRPLLPRATPIIRPCFHYRKVALSERNYGSCIFLFMLVNTLCNIVTSMN